ncbi:MAG TPA: glycosyltransferase family 4 protein [Flavipsychrobacter sp.]|nr:glycosyltransferase family 4 protein [Flavipsychrobacter sp.]
MIAQKKKIGIVCTSPGFGGLEMYTLELAQALKQLGWEVKLLLNEKSNLYGHSRELFDAVTIQRYAKEKNTASVIRKWNKTENCSLLFTPYNKDIKPLAIYKRFSGKNIRIVYQQHMKVGVRKRDFIHRLRYNMLDLWITPLEYLRQETLEKTTIPDRKIRIVPVGLELDKFQNVDISQSSARTQLELPADAFIIGVLGRVDPKKGQDFLIKAVASLKSKSAVHLLIMGDVTAYEGNDWLQYLHQLVKENGLEHRVHFRSYQQEVLLFYKAIDVFAMSSHGETYGLVTLEAMYCGRPVIGVNTDGTKALLEGGKFGWLYNLDDLESFSRQLSYIMQQPEETKEKIKQAKQHVANQYQFSYTASAMDAILSELL